MMVLKYIIPPGVENSSQGVQVEPSPLGQVYKALSGSLASASSPSAASGPRALVICLSPPSTLHSTWHGQALHNVHYMNLEEVDFSDSCFH